MPGQRNGAGDKFYFSIMSTIIKEAEGVGHNVEDLGRSQCHNFLNLGQLLKRAGFSSVGYLESWKCVK